jgi:hypothetical protein
VRGQEELERAGQSVTAIPSRVYQDV